MARNNNEDQPGDRREIPEYQLTDTDSSSPQTGRSWVASIVMLFLGSAFVGIGLALPGVIMPDIQHTFGFGVFTASLVGSITFMFVTVTLFTIYGTLYLTHNGYSLIAAGGIIAGWSVGGIIGNLVLPVLSDFIGRKYTGALALFAGAIPGDPPLLDPQDRNSVRASGRGRDRGRATSVRRVPPLLGEHSQEVLDELGYARSEIAALAEKGVISLLPR